MLCFHYCYTFFLARQNDAPVTKIKICSIYGETWLTRHLERTARKYVLWRGRSKQHTYISSWIYPEYILRGGGLCNVNRLVIVRHQWSSEKSQEGRLVPFNIYKVCCHQVSVTGV